MRRELIEDRGSMAEDDDLGPLLDVMFILLIGLMVVLTVFAQKEYENRFAVPQGPGQGLIVVTEADYRRMVVVSMDSERRPAVNGQHFEEEQLVAGVLAVMAELGVEDSPVVFNADPTIAHGDAERVHLLLLGNNFTVLKEYEEIDHERPRH